MVRSGITYKIFAALTVASTLSVLITAAIMQWSIHRGFMQYMSAVENEGIPRLVKALEEEYLTSGGWAALCRQPERWRKLVASSLYDEAAQDISAITPESAGKAPGMLPPHIAKEFDRRLFLSTPDKELLIGKGSLKDATLYPITHKGVLTGYLGLFPQLQPAGTAQENFLKQQHRTLLISVIIVITLSTLLSLFITRRMVRPVKNLTLATRSLASGEYHIRVPVISNDELGQLATDFNALALALEHNEGARRRWVADISHELRTPLTFIRSQVEAILDGVRQPTPDAIMAIHNEIIRFTRLVDDLHQLSMSDVGAQTYRKEILDISIPLRQTVLMMEGEFAARKITLQYQTEENITLYGDSGRLRQLFSNLLDNSLKYTESPGVLHIKTHKMGDRAVIVLQDSAPGVPEADLVRLFDRLYRVESSRNRNSGGSGLGLAICRNIVEAHEGSISAQPSPLGGLLIRVELPCKGRG